ncbi:MAG TPA: substrate-binding domain-containing protein, partial [Acidimicrobiia bacterium]
NDIPFFALTPIGVTKDNIAETVIADGFRTVEEICTDDIIAATPQENAAALEETCSATPTADTGGGDIAGPIWVLLPDSATSDRWENDDRRFFEEAFDAAGLTAGTDYTIVNAEGDSQTQLNQAEQAINDGASVVLFVEIDSGSGAAIIDTLRAADVKVINYDRLTIEGPGADLYVSFDNVQVGRTMAEIMAPVIDGLEGTPRVVMLNGGPEDNNATLFRQGYNETVEARVDAGEWELVADQAVPGWDNQTALTIAEQILVDANNDVDAIFAANDGLGNSAAVAVENAGLGSIPISGQDATAVGMQNLLLGRQLMSVYKPIKNEAGVAAAAALALARGESLDSVTSEFSFESSTINNGTNDIPFFALTPIGVTADNIAETVIADGFRTVEEICTDEVRADATQTDALAEVCD